MGETLEKKTLKFSKNFDSLSDAYVERYRDFMKNPAPLQEQFAKDMLDLILNDVDTNCITVIPGRCGISKSIFVQSIISFFLRGADYKFRYDGTIKLIIITDMMRRLKDYQRPPERPQSVWFSDTSDRLKHNKYCAYLTSDPKDNDGKTAMEQLVQSYYKPIVLLSTQRYFTMSDDQREMLFKCKKGTREIVIFDEKPQFYTSKKITAKNFALCAAAIQHGIPKSEGEVKKIYLDEFWNFRKKMETLLRDKERAKFNGPVDRFYWRDTHTPHITKNDDEFFELIEKHKGRIRAIYPDAIQDLKTFKELMTDGAFFISMSSKAGEDIETFFLQYRANWDKFYLTQNKAKFFVFDSSADIDPDYSIDYCRMMNCSKYRTNLNLSINQININASKSQIVKNNNKNAPQIRAAIWKRIQEESRKTKNGLLTITYSELDSFFIGGRVKRGHFGGIKGLNTFSDLTKVFHIGNNRLSEFEYFMKMILLKPEILEELKQMDEEESRRYIEDAIAMKMGLYVDNELNELMYRSILADFEQNIFRVKIRDFRNTDHVEVFAYWDSNMFDRLNELIKERYEPLGVKFKCLGVPAEIKKIKVETRQSKNGEKTIPQRILTWIDKQPTGNEFRVAKILSELDITDKQFQKAKKNQVIADLFKNMSTGQKGIYRVNPP